MQTDTPSSNPVTLPDNSTQLDKPRSDAAELQSLDTSDSRIVTLEATAQNLRRRIERIERSALFTEFEQPAGFAVSPPNQADDLRIIIAAKAAIRTVIETAPTTTIPVNKETPVVFSVADIGLFGKRTPVIGATITCEFGGAPAASMANARSGTKPRTVVGANGKLKVTTDVNGDALVYITDTKAETFNLTGILTGYTGQPSAVSAITTA